MPIAIVFIIIALLPSMAAWREWMVVDRRSLMGTRKASFMTGLCVATLALLEYLGFELYTVRIGGFGTNFSAVFRWTRPGFWASVLALLLIPAGRGKSRLFGLSSSGLMAILWTIPIWGM